MTEHAAFLNAVMERPDDDLPRLVYADYLEEAGDVERAEFIRVQLELSNSEEDNPDRPWLEYRAEELSKGHAEWRLPIRGIQRFQRGFVESMATTADWLIAAGPVLHLAPVRELRVINADNSIAALAQVPGLDRIETLDLRNNSFGTRDRLARFLELAPLGKMTGLLLLNNQLWSDDIAVLVRSPRAAQLRALDLSGNAIGNAGVEILAAAQRLSGLRRLVIRSDDLDYRDRINVAGARSLAASPVLDELRTLSMGGQLIGEDGIAALAASLRLPNLETIDAAFNRVGFGDDSFDLDLESFFASAPREPMRRWNLAGSRITLRAAEGFAVWDQLETLSELNLENSRWSPGAYELLSESPWADKIRMGNPSQDELA
jgi:uncharacterized protein (TIGR02996 family)